MTLTFEQQIWLAIIDKLAFGVALVGVGYVANRYLESHKIRQAFSAEIAKQRIAAMTEIWAALGEYEMEAYRAVSRGFEVILRELKAAGAEVPDPLPRDAQQLAALISVAKHQVELSDAATERVDLWITENANTTHAQVDRVMNMIAAKRFLIGNAAASTFEEYQKAIHTTFRLLGPSKEQIEQYRVAFPQLKKLRAEVESTSKEVFG